MEIIKKKNKVKNVEGTKDEVVLSAYNEEYTAKKNRGKVIRTVIETLVCIWIIYIFVTSVFVLSKYKPYDESEVKMADNSDENGFCAISYFGVDRTGTQTLVDDDRLKEHLAALSDNGFVTLTQEDVIDYYYKGKKLPQKALFLMFEDGRRDTSIFAEKITEKYNFLSTMMTYAYKFEENDPTFLTPKNIEELKKSTYWEFGTNGYRLEYINVFDRYDRFLGQLNTKKYNQISPYLGRDYNHYLMDYIRDEHDIPIETRFEMKKRIDGDYEKLKEIYEDKCGEVPQLYVLMHANTGMFAENEVVSEVNRENIEDLFLINFNREGYCRNDKRSSEYDLTRMQPQPYWHTNHLLMRIRDDYEKAININFVKGDEDRYSKYTLLEGAAEFNGDEIYVTCESEGFGRVKLNRNDVTNGDFILSTELLGNAYGRQIITLFANDEDNSGLDIATENKELIIRENGHELYREFIDEIIGTPKVSIDEDDYAALMQERETFMQYAEDTDEAYEYSTLITEQMNEVPASVEDGAKEYIPSLELKESADHKLKIYVKDEMLTVTIDDCMAVKNLKINTSSDSNIYLTSGWGGDFYSQRNLTDDVYDGVFKQLKITKNTGLEKEEDEEVIYDNCLHGYELFKYNAKVIWNKVIDFFVDVF